MPKQPHEAILVLLVLLVGGIAANAWAAAPPKVAGSVQFTDTGASGDSANFSQLIASDTLYALTTTINGTLTVVGEQIKNVTNAPGTFQGLDKELVISSQVSDICTAINAADQVAAPGQRITIQRRDTPYPCASTALIDRPLTLAASAPARRWDSPSAATDTSPVRIQYSGQGVAIRIGTTTTTGLESVHIEGISIEPAVAGRGYAGIVVDAVTGPSPFVKGIDFKDVTVENFAGYGIRMNGTIFDATFNHVTVLGNRLGGIVNDNTGATAGDASQITLTDCWISSYPATTSWGADLSGESVRFFGGTVTAGASGGVNGNGVRLHKGGIIQGTHFEGEGYGVAVRYTGSNGLIFDGLHTGWATGIQIGDPTDKATSALDWLLMGEISGSTVDVHVVDGGGRAGGRILSTGQGGTFTIHDDRWGIDSSPGSYVMLDGTGIRTNFIDQATSQQGVNVSGVAHSFGSVLLMPNGTLGFPGVKFSYDASGNMELAGAGRAANLSIKSNSPTGIPVGIHFEASDASKRFSLLATPQGTTSNDVLCANSLGVNNILCIKASGAVCIDCATPGYALDMNGEVRLRSTNKLWLDGTSGADATANLYSPSSSTVKTDSNFIVAGATTLTGETSVAAAKYALVTLTPASHTLGATDYIAMCDASTGAVTIDPPTANNDIGRVLVIVKTDATANACTFDPLSSQLVNGAATYALTTQYQRAQLTSVGSGWIIIGT